LSSFLENITNSFASFTRSPSPQNNRSAIYYSSPVPVSSTPPPVTALWKFFHSLLTLYQDPLVNALTLLTGKFQFVIQDLVISAP
jgi:hypothetical protein